MPAAPAERPRTNHGLYGLLLCPCRVNLRPHRTRTAPNDCDFQGVTQSIMDAATPPRNALLVTHLEHEAVLRLFAISAQDNYQGYRVADCLLALRDSRGYGQICVHSLHTLPQEVARDVVSTIDLVVRNYRGLSELGYALQFQRVIPVTRRTHEQPITEVVFHGPTQAEPAADRPPLTSGHSERTKRC